MLIKQLDEVFFTKEREYTVGVVVSEVDGVYISLIQHWYKGDCDSSVTDRSESLAEIEYNLNKELEEPVKIEIE